MIRSNSDSYQQIRPKLHGQFVPTFPKTGHFVPTYSRTVLNNINHLNSLIILIFYAVLIKNEYKYVSKKIYGLLIGKNDILGMINIDNY